MFLVFGRFLPKAFVVIIILGVLWFHRLVLLYFPAAARLVIFFVPLTDPQMVFLLKI